jgi:hypothetical protein
VKEAWNEKIDGVVEIEHMDYCKEIYEVQGQVSE